MKLKHMCIINACQRGTGSFLRKIFNMKTFLQKFHNVKISRFTVHVMMHMQLPHAQNSPLNEGSHTGRYLSISLQFLCAQHIIEGGGCGLNELGTRGGVVTLDVLLLP